MNTDMLKPIDDNALESVSGGHGVLADIAGHVKEHVEHVVDAVGDVAGGALQLIGKTLTKIGGKIAD